MLYDKYCICDLTKGARAAYDLWWICHTYIIHLVSFNIFLFPIVTILLNQETLFTFIFVNLNVMSAYNIVHLKHLK